MKKVLLLVALGFFCCLTAVCLTFTGLYFIGENATPDYEAQMKDVISAVEEYELAALQYSALNSLSTESISYQEWQERIADNKKSWQDLIDRLDVLENRLAGLGNRREEVEDFANQRQLIVRVAAQELPATENEAENLLGGGLETRFNLPEVYQQELIADMRSASTKYQTSLQQLSTVTEGEYKEAEFTTEFNPNSGPSNVELVFMAAGNYIPFSGVSSNLSTAAQAELMAKSLAFIIGADYAFSKSPTGTVIFHQMAPEYFADSPLIVDTSKLAPQAQLYAFDSTREGTPEISAYQDFPKYVNQARQDLSISVSLLDLSVILTIDQSVPNRKVHTETTMTKQEIEDRIRLVKLAKAVFPKGDYRIQNELVQVENDGNEDTIDQVEDPAENNTNYQSDSTNQIVAGTYLSEFIYNVAVSGGTENVRILITIAADNSAECKLTADLPYHTYTYPGTQVTAGLSGSASGTFSGKYDPVRKRLSCEGSASATSTSTIMGQTDSATTSGTAKIEAIFKDNDTLSGSLSSPDVPDLGRLDFTAVRQ